MQVPIPLVTSVSFDLATGLDLERSKLPHRLTNLEDPYPISDGTISQIIPGGTVADEAESQARKIVPDKTRV